ncbi:hypothetical protein [Clostridium butyricum]|uniref:hypothetical protein n=1 Tax=Clostridium butyricum TaxID=1492 RepID=UPI00189D96BA|nr:hypothetical protein [Clostridium butyricum]MDB2153817.1 hypothetical protein [Clostridium butyricum]
MLTNEEFNERIFDLEEYRQISLDRRKNIRLLYYIERSQEKLNKISINEKAKVKVIFDGSEERFYRSKYINYNTVQLNIIRKRNFKVYYCTNRCTLEELKKVELNQMINHYYKIKRNTRKAFIMFLKSYVVIDESLLIEMINIISDTRQQKYKKMIVLERFKKENSLEIGDLFKELEGLSELEVRRVKEMDEYNKKLKC